jgi:SAM-dependent methyltransferase
MAGMNMDRTFDTSLSFARRARALRRRTGDADFLMRRAAAELADRLSHVGRDFEHAAAIHCTTGDAALALLGAGKVARVTRVEAERSLAGPDGLVCDPADLPEGLGDLDLAVSLHGLDTVDDVPGMLVRVRRALRPDGLFLGCMAGGGTLGELRQSLLQAEAELSGGAAPRVHPFIDVRDAGALLQRAGFALPVADVDEVVVRYDDMFALLADLRAMGATSALLGRRPAGRSLFARAAEIYAERFADPDGRVRATFSTVWLSGWAPHASQQKPLRPGSATVSLADYLERGGGSED